MDRSSYERLRKLSTEELERGLDRNLFDDSQRRDVWRILRRRYSMPDRIIQFAILGIAGATLIITLLS